MDYFEDLRIGTRTVLGSHTFSADDIKAFAARYDPQPFHLDEEAGRRSLFGGLCASGWHTASVAIRMVVLERQRRAAERRARGETVVQNGPSPGLRDMKWLAPVFAGDTLDFVSEIVDLRGVRSRPGWGLMFSRVTATNQHGAPVYSYVGSLFVPRRPHS